MKRKLREKERHPQKQTQTQNKVVNAFNSLLLHAAERFFFFGHYSSVKANFKSLPAFAPNPLERKPLVHRDSVAYFHSLLLNKINKNKKIGKIKQDTKVICI